MQFDERLNQFTEPLAIEFCRYMRAFASFCLHIRNTSLQSAGINFAFALQINQNRNNYH